MYVDACLKLPGPRERSPCRRRTQPAAPFGDQLLVHCQWGTMPTPIILADDHALGRQGIKSLVEIEGLQVVAEASDGREAIRHAEALAPDVVIMDIGMPTLNGMEAARELARCCPKVKPILLTQHDEPQYVSAALSAGVKGYVLKSQISGELIHANQQVVRRHDYMSTSIF